MSKKSKQRGRIILLIVLILLGGIGYVAYESIFKSNVHLNGKNYQMLYVPTGSTYEDLLDILYSEDLISNHESFEWTAKSMGLQHQVMPGRYRITATMSNRQIVNMLKKGKQEKVKVSLNTQIHTKEEFADYVSSKLEIDKIELLEDFWYSTLLEKQYGINSENAMILIVPKTYELEWTTHADEFKELLKQEFDKRWTNDKRKRARQMGYSISEITILASIVQSESVIKTEQQKIAGVYLNRLNQNMPLQADPTLVFANGDFSIQRVTNADKEIDSPYNTYKNKGLPPGPICLVYPQAIDAVLNYTKHNYIYFCAKPDFSGYSNFSVSYDNHLKNAKAYQEALDKKNIKR